ncbi:MAG: hypothetical protein F7C34_02765 [Desulfurococcales archaeon]|nr:hypothetical protein [Desulfurococcales archaeon]
MSEWDEFRSEEEEEETILPYGIKPREVYYQCLYCGYIISKSELDQHDNIMCTRCGGRILLKIRGPGLPPRKVYAI